VRLAIGSAEIVISSGRDSALHAVALRAKAPRTTVKAAVLLL
jgi:hypothetical protein